MTDPISPEIKPYQKHVFICTGPRCAPQEAPEVYRRFKERLKELRLNEGPERIQRSQCHCFGICQGGPLVVVYPEGLWYHHVSAEKMERILQEHLIGGVPVKEFLFHSAPARPGSPDPAV